MRLTVQSQFSQSFNEGEINPRALESHVDKGNKGSESLAKHTMKQTYRKKQKYEAEQEASQYLGT